MLSINNTHMLLFFNILKIKKRFNNKEYIELM